MIEKLTTKVSINTQGEAIRFANECYEEKDKLAIGFAEWTRNLTYRDWHASTTEELLETYKKTL